jgi:anti-sigma regulatory factor (Ser/Thr protein kinase)
LGEVVLAIRLRLPPDTTAPGMARDRLVELTPPVPSRIIEDVRLLVSELVTNAVKYAGLQQEETIDLVVRVRPTRVEVLVLYPEHVGFAPTLPPEPSEASRWGLLLVDRISDRWSVVQSQSQIEAWFEINLPRRIAA